MHVNIIKVDRINNIENNNTVISVRVPARYTKSFDMLYSYARVLLE